MGLFYWARLRSVDGEGDKKQRKHYFAVGLRAFTCP